MIKLNYIAHKLLHSKYRLILFLTFYIIIIIFYNYNNINYAYCEENSTNNITSNNKLLGLGLFLGSIALMLFIQNGGGNDPSTFIDMTMQLHNQGTLLNTPEFLDYFTLTKDGKLFINNVNIDTNNLYLNANEVIRQIQLEDKYKHVLTETFNRLQAFDRKFNIPTQDTGNLERMLPIHLEYMNNLISIFTLQSLNLSYHANFINALETAGILNPNYLLLLNEYVSNSGQPDQFYTFLISRIQR